MSTENEKKERSISYEDGRLYFTKQLERRIFFALTLLMMIWGILTKLGVFS